MTDLTGFDQFLEYIDVDPSDDPYLLWLAEQAFNAPLPPNWSEYNDQNGRVYFSNHLTGQCDWSHPLDQLYRDVIRVVREIRARRSSLHKPTRQEVLDSIEHDLSAFHKQALDAIEGWSGPYVSPDDASPYYYNENLKVSTWANPLEEWEYKLHTRVSLLCRCLMDDEGLEESEESEQTSSAKLHQSLLERLKLPLHLVRPGTAGSSDQPPTPSSTRTFVTARSSGLASSRTVTSDVSPPTAIAAPPPPGRDSSGQFIRLPVGTIQE